MTSSDFRHHRHQLGLTQAELAKMMGMTQQAVARLETGERRPTKQHAATMRLLLRMWNYGCLPG